MMTLSAAYIKDVDILGLLSPDKIEAIEDLALSEYERNNEQDYEE